MAVNPIRRHMGVMARTTDIIVGAFTVVLPHILMAPRMAVEDQRIRDAMSGEGTQGVVATEILAWEGAMTGMVGLLH